MKKLETTFFEILNNATKEEVDYVCELCNEKAGEDVSAIDFFDEIEDAEVIPTDANIYIIYDTDVKVPNLFYGVNVYKGGKYNEEIEGPEEFESVGLSVKGLLGGQIFIDSKSSSILRKNANIIAALVWEVIQYGSTEEEREQVAKIFS